MTIETCPSLAAYFAAHAPAEVPKWYRALQEGDIDADFPAIKAPSVEDAAFILGRPITAEEARQLRNWIADPCWDLEGDCHKFQAVTERARLEQSKRMHQKARRLFFSWRTFYGEFMAALFEDGAAPGELGGAGEGDDTVTPAQLEQRGFPRPEAG